MLLMLLDENDDNYIPARSGLSTLPLAAVL